MAGLATLLDLGAALPPTEPDQITPPLSPGPCRGRRREADGPRPRCTPGRPRARSSGVRGRRTGWRSGGPSGPWSG